jgi:hypothetical protein
MELEMLRYPELDLVQVRLLAVLLSLVAFSFPSSLSGHMSHVNVGSGVYFVQVRLLVMLLLLCCIGCVLLSS